MTKPLIDRTLYDHPEHFDDEIRAYRTSSRYVPTALESLLYELSGHRCTICGAPWLEVHHIEELGNGGHTTYDNMIVLCPNCHTRVHSEGIPSKDELRHYKLKQEIAYELPVLSRLSPEERALVFEIARLSPDRQLAFSRRYHANVSAPNQDEAIEKCRTDVGHLHLCQSQCSDSSIKRVPSTSLLQPLFFLLSTDGAH